MSEQVDAMFERWSQPVHAAMRNNVEPLAHAALAEAETDRAALDPAGPDTEALNVALRLLRLQTDTYFTPSAAPGEAARARILGLLDSAAAEFASLDPESAAGRVMRGRARLYVACAADRARLRELPAAQLNELLAALPPEDRDEASWYCLAYWAFKHAHLDHMFDVYTEFLVRRKPTMTRYNWERIRLLHLLTAGQAIFRDIEAAIDKLPHKRQAVQFADYIKPRCAELEMWDEKLELKFVLKMVDLEEREQEPPQPDPELVFGLPH